MCSSATVRSWPTSDGVTLAVANEAFAAFGGVFGPVHEHLVETLKV